MESCNRYDCILFPSGEAVIDYCAKEDSAVIDLLFLDIEMQGISGIEVKEKMLKQDKVWRIVFVSSHKESVWSSFGLKTLGFIIKPAKQGEINKWIQLVEKEKEENVLVEIQESNQNGIHYFRQEELLYFKADGNYAEVFFRRGGKNCTLVIVKKLGELEKELQKTSLLRVHKSYMVNLANVTDMGQDITLREVKEHIPIGKIYKSEVKKKYVE